MSDTGTVNSEDVPFEGGPLDGRVLPVLLGLTGQPPKTYRVPVPDAAGGPPTVLVYRREPRVPGRPFALSRRWKYVYDPEGDAGQKSGPRWPWSKAGSGAGPEAGSEPGPEAGPDADSGAGSEAGSEAGSGRQDKPDATPGGKPEGTDG